MERCHLPGVEGCGGVMSLHLCNGEAGAFHWLPRAGQIHGGERRWGERESKSKKEREMRGRGESLQLTHYTYTPAKARWRPSPTTHTSIARGNSRNWRGLYILGRRTLVTQKAACPTFQFSTATTKNLFQLQIHSSVAEIKFTQSLCWSSYERSKPNIIADNIKSSRLCKLLWFCCP